MKKCFLIVFTFLIVFSGLGCSTDIQSEKNDDIQSEKEEDIKFEKIESEKLDLLSKDMTSSDSYVVDGVTGTIKEYLNNQNNNGREDEIVYIIPKELFTTVGYYHYLGYEYGFYVETKKDNKVYYNNVLVYDINVGNLKLNNSSLELKVLFINKYITKENENKFFVSFLENINDDHLYVSNIRIETNLLNKNKPNQVDEGYRLFGDDIRTVIDKGDILRSISINVSRDINNNDNHNLKITSGKDEKYDYSRDDLYKDIKNMYLIQLPGAMEQRYFIQFYLRKIVFEIDENRIFTVDDYVKQNISVTTPSDYISDCQDMILKYNISFNIFSNENIVFDVKTEKVFYYNKKDTYNK